MKQSNQITLDERIYPTGVIDKAIADYANIVQISYILSSDTNKIQLYFSDFEIDFEIVRNEFCNYLIDLLAASIG